MAQTWSGGHSAAVLCVQAAGGGAGLLASGAEGGEVTLWSQEGTPVAQLRLAGGDDVTCAAFSPAAPGLLYVSHGDAVSVLDPRNMKEPVVERLSGIGEDDEEINGLSFNDTGAMLAAGDDSGAVRLVEVQSGKVVRTLRRHTNICSSVAFRPQRPQSLVTAGLDMQVLLWSLQKARPVWAVSLQQEHTHTHTHTQEQPGKLFNPPLAHCVTVATCGNVFATAAEDGRLHLMRVGAGSRLEHQGALQAHSQGASQAHFLSFLSHPYWLVSGGNDGVVALWDVSAEGLPPVAKTSNCSSRPAASRRKARGRHRATNQQQARARPQEQEQEEQEEKEEEEEASGGSVCADSGESVCVDSGTEKKRGPAVSFTHGDKVNWVCPALLQGRPSLLVADQSTDLYVYPLTAL